MGLSDWFTGGSDDSPDDDEPGDGRINGKEWVHDHYEVKRSGPDNNGGWATVAVAGQEEWGYPITEREFRANMTDPDPGKYRLWSVDKNGIHHPPREQDEEWILEIEDDSMPEPDTDPSVQRLESKVDALAGRLEDSGGMPHDPDQMVEYARAQIAMGALNSKQFLDRYGAEIAMGVLGGSAEEEGIGFDEWQESPIGATIYESISNPQKVEDLGEAFGSASSNFLSGFMDEFDGGGESRSLTTGEQTQSAPDAEQQAEEQPADAPDTAEEGADDGGEIDSGPSSLDGLAESIPDDAAPDMEEVTQEFAETNIAMQDQRTQESETGPEPDFPDPDEATNGDADPDTEFDVTTDPDPAPESSPENGRSAISEDFNSEETDHDSTSGEQGSDDGEQDADSGDRLVPETPGELRDLTWNELQQVASRNGLNPGEFGGQEALRSELERQMFGTPSGDDIEEATTTAADGGDDLPDGDMDAQSATQTEGENPSPDAVAEGL